MSEKHTYVIAIDAANEYALDEDFTNKYMAGHKKDRHLIKVVTIKQMLHAIAHKVKGRLLSGLMILGHGRPGMQGVGLSSFGHVASQNKDEKWHQKAVSQTKQQPHLEPGPEGTYDFQKDPDGLRSLRLDGSGKLVGDGRLLNKLKGKFTAHAVVVLGGCEVGAGDKGDDLLKEVSRILGNVRVQAGIEKQNPLKAGCEGKCKEVYNGVPYFIDGKQESQLWTK